MVLFIFGLIVGAYALARREMQAWYALGSLALMATFAPLYGNGKNVLGEVPGLFFTILFLLCLSYIESGKTNWRVFLLAGLALGFAIVTKPIFLLMLPAVGAVMLFSRHLLTLRNVLAGLAGFAVSGIVWLWIQFSGTTFAEVFGHYANPNGVSAGVSLLSNMRIFLTQVEPLYALALAGVWALSFAIRLYCRRSISRAEWVAGLFALLVYAAFLRTSGFYRYFFVGEMLALLYLPLSLKVVSACFTTQFVRRTPAALLVLLVCFQTYQVFFHSWVADHYQSHRAQALEVLHELPADKTIFLYNTPEAAVFLPTHMQYYQYLNITKKLQIGKDEIAHLSAGMADYVLVPVDASSTIDLSHYAYVRTIDRYSLWYKK